LDKVNKIIKKTKGSSQSFVCDVTNTFKFNSIVSNLKRLDILVNNAGNNRPEHFIKVKKSDMDYMVNLNLKACFNIAQICTKKMLMAKNRKNTGGSIINMSSQLGKVGAPIRSVYNMTKFGLEGLTRGMAIDLAKNNIRVNTVCPTFVLTPMVKEFFKNKKFKKEMIKNIPLGRVAEESDVATAVAFLAGDSSAMITGTSLVVDGGWTAK
jgi:NAD(P)-dependent dehydrogenase (short-subunit alcohol dehydrogenase family)